MKKWLIDNKILLIILFVGSLLRFSLVFIRPIAPDELWTFFYLKNNLSTIIYGSFADFKPPLYYLILLIWTAVFGQSITALRLFSLLTSLVSAIFMYQSAKLLLNKKQAQFTLLLLALSAGFIYDGVDGRMFGLGIMASSLILWANASFGKTRKRQYFFWISLSLLFASYTYLYLLLFIPGIYILNVRHIFKRRLLFLHLLFIALLLPLFIFVTIKLPLLAAFHKNLSTSPAKFLAIFLIPFIPSEIIFVSLAKTPVNRLFLLLICIITLIVIYLTVKGFIVSTRFLKKLSLAFLFLPLGILIISSLTIRSLIGIHSLIFFTPIILILLTKVSAHSLKLKALILFIAIIGSSCYWRNLDLLKTDVRPYQYLQQNYRQTDLILQEDIYPFLWTRYFIPNALQQGIKPSSFNPEIEKVFGYRYSEAEKKDYLQIFLVTGKSDQQQSLALNGYQITAKHNFTDLRIITFIKSQAFCAKR